MTITGENFNALKPNIPQETKDEIEKFLLEKLKGRDFVLICIEFPTSFIATNASTPQAAKDILNKALGKPWS